MQRAAAIQTLLGTAKLNGLNPADWLKETLEKLPTWPNSRIASFDSSIHRSDKTEVTDKGNLVATVAYDRITHHRGILETGSDFYRFKQSKKASGNQ